MPNNEGPVSEVIQTCDQCKFITYGYKCGHPDAPPDSDLLVSENGDETYTPNWCPVGRHEMVAVRKDDLEILLDYASGVYSEWFEPDGKAEVIERAITLLRKEEQ